MSAPVRHFIQIIEGDTFVLRYVQKGTIRDVSGGGAEADWTVDATLREEWDMKAEAVAWRDKLGKGYVVHTDLHNPDIEEEIRVREKHEPPPIIPEEVAEEHRLHRENPDDPTRWWDR